MNRLIDYSSRFRILKGGKISLVVSALLGSAIIANASPSGGTVTSGTATINQSGNITNINQSSSKATINWQNFSIANGETVNFNQPNSSSITLNRVIGNETSVINGALNANGQVWLLNSNGVLFGKNASINTSGLLATTAELSDADFNAGNYNFKNSSSNSVINEGTITVVNSGSVILASNEVVNEGTIKAIKGKVHLVGADSYSLNLNGNSLVNLTIDKGVLDALVENSGTIIADGGEIYLTTNAVDELLKGVVNNTGVIEANSLDGITGKVELFAHGGEAKVGGNISAVDGFVETSGKDFIIQGGAEIKAGEWLIDPVDITIDSTLASTIQTALGSGDVTITTDGSNTPDTSSGESGTTGDITVSSAITWSTAQKLTLDAANDIFINAAITANGGGQLELLYGQGAVNAGNSANYYVNSIINLQAGDNFFTKLGSDGTLTTWKVITDLGSEGSTTGTDLQGINGNLSGNYVLGANIDATNTLLWDGGAGWTSIGYDTNPSTMAFDGTPFSGNFDGLGHTIEALYINRTNTYFLGLFGKADSSSVIRNLGLTNVDVTGKFWIGGLIGQSDGLLENVYTTGTIDGKSSVGGVAGKSFTIKNSYSSATILGGDTTGGLTGYSGKLIEKSYATGDVTGSSNYVGGLVGQNRGATGDTADIVNSFALGNVSGADSVGGLIGGQIYGTTSTSYSTGQVTGTGTKVAGLVGENFTNESTITNSYWDIDTSGQSVGRVNYASSSADATGIKSSTATVDAFNEATYVGFDFTNDWFILEGDTRPMLRSQHTNNIANQYELQLISMDKSANYTINNDIDFGADIQTNQSDIWNIATGFDPIGQDWSSRFSGELQGLNNGWTISNLFINRASEDNVGLIGYAGYGSNIYNVHFADADVTGQNFTGILAGNSSAEIDAVTTSGIVTGVDHVGGIAGSAWGDKFTGLSSSATVTGNDYVGGIVGDIGTEGGDPFINSLESTGDVSGANDVGGVAGFLYGVTVSNSSATGAVTATGDIAGGLVGTNDGSIIQTSYATGDVTAANIAGGLVGFNKSAVLAYSGNNYYSESTISNSFATGAVSATDKAGGFVGENSTDYGNAISPTTTSATIQNSYSTGSVSGTTNVGGFVGLNDSDGVISNSYYDKILVTGMLDEANFGQTTEDMKSFSFFDDASWSVQETSELSDVYPQLRWMAGVSGMNRIWVIGEAAVVPPVTTSTTPTNSSNSDTEKVITAITNNTVFTAPKIEFKPIQVAPRAQQVVLGATGKTVSVLSQPTLNQNTKMVTMGELKSNSENGSTPNANSDIRVPVGDNSVIDLINGGVLLPFGLEQQFFVPIASNEI